MIIHLVIKYFEDKENNRHPYHVGDIFPVKGYEVSDERIKELETNDNRQKQPLIEAVNLDKLKKDELIDVANKLNVELTGEETKKEIIERIGEL